MSSTNSCSQSRLGFLLSAKRGQGGVLLCWPFPGAGLTTTFCMMGLLDAEGVKWEDSFSMADFLELTSMGYVRIHAAYI